MARALDLHSRGQGFDSLILHKESLKFKVQGSKLKKLLTINVKVLNSKPGTRNKKKMLQNGKKA